MSLFRRLLRQERGATAIEYALIAGAIATVLVAGATAIGRSASADLNSAAAGFTAS